jgi:prepilin-type N-terminal cleavage/methylation domain-containing protein
MKFHSSRAGQAAFTLVELITVITIIAILAGLVVGGMDYALQRQKFDKAKVQVALLSRALEEYKIDMGTYPATSNVSGGLATSAGSNTSSTIFNALYWTPNINNQKIYLPELDPATSKQKWTTGTASASTTIIDPWGNQYCYRSATNTTGAKNTNTVNEADFDLWSMGKDGKTNASDASAAVDPNKDDIRNF